MTTKWIGEDGRPHDHTSFCRGNGCTPVPATPAPSQPMSAVRMDEMGVDDVAIDATMFRFERMDEQTFWLCAYRGDKRTTFTMWAQAGKLYCRKDDDELGTTDDSAEGGQQ